MGEMDEVTIAAPEQRGRGCGSPPEGTEAVAVGPSGTIYGTVTTHEE